jgi:O-antigen/teichoic acid export membrane protein
MHSSAADDLPVVQLEDLSAEGAIPSDVKKDLIQGTSALGIGVVVERACSFIANILAARLGGASTFGVYALSLSTANNVSAYAAGGIGSTSIRFSAEHPRGSPGYGTLARVLAIISILSAVLAAAVLWFGAAPISRLLGKDSLTSVLRWSAFSAAGIILLECCRGFLVGQRKLKALLLLSGMVGFGYMAFLPIMSRHGAVSMVRSQSAVIIGAVLVIVALYRLLGLASPVTVTESKPVGPLLKQVWGFGIVQLASFMGMNAAGWWLTTLVARSDTTMVQMGFFAVAHQLRNMVALGPSLLTEGSLAVMASSSGKFDKTPDNVMAMCAYASTLASLIMAGVGMILAPWGLVHVYGHNYSSAGLATAIALATAVIHMGSAPISARLSILSIKTFGMINTAWAIFVAISATLFLFHGGNAAKGAMVYLTGHLFLAVLQIWSLNKSGSMPRGSIISFAAGVGGTVILVGLAWLRNIHEDSSIQISLLMLAVLLVFTLLMVSIGKQRNWLPSWGAIASLARKGVGFIRPGTSRT